MMIFGRFAVMVVLVMLGASHADARTPVSKQMANQYYQTCSSKPVPGMSAQSHQLMCACTASKMMESFSVEDIQAMAKKDDNARFVFNRMLIDVYAPCIEYPAREHYYNTCVNNPETAKFREVPQQLCTCLANEMGEYLKKNAQEVFKGILARNPTAEDPMVALTSDPEFQLFAQRRLVACAQ